MTWTTIPLNRVASVRARIGWRALTAAEYVDEGYAFLSTPNIKDRRIDFENVNYINQFRWDESPELQLEIGDVLLAKDGSTLGIANVVRELPRPATVNGSIAVIRPSDIDSRFLYYSLSGARIQSRINELRDGMGVPHLFQRDINRLDIPLPPVEEQRRIADFLDDQVGRMDALGSIRAASLKLLGQRKSSAASREMEGHRKVPLRRLVTCLDGQRVPLNAEERSGMSGEYPYWGAGSIVDHVDRYLFHEELVLLGEDGAPFFDPARDVAFRVTDPVWVNNHIHVLRPNELVLGRYLTHALNDVDYSGVVTGATRDKLTQSDMMSIPIPLPSRADQERIADSLDALAEGIQAIAAQYETILVLLKERKRALITAAVTGEMDVTTARPITMGRWVPGVGADVPPPAPTAASSLGGI